MAYAPKPPQNWANIKKGIILNNTPINVTFYHRKIHNTPIIDNPKEMIVEILLPFVSDMRFITIRPKNDPIENTD